MQVLKTLPPGTNGTKRFAAEYGDKLVCVRYRLDEQGQRRVTTIELIVEEKRLPTIMPVTPEAKYPNTLVHVPIQFHESALRQRAKHLGAKWLPHLRAWEMSYHTALQLGITSRIDGSEWIK